MFGRNYKGKEMLSRGVLLLQDNMIVHKTRVAVSTIDTVDTSLTKNHTNKNGEIKLLNFETERC